MLDKIVVGFVILVIGIFTILALYTVRFTQKRLLNATISDLTQEGQYLTTTIVNDYINYNLDTKELCSALDTASENLNCQIWFANNQGQIIYRTSSISKDSDIEADAVVTMSDDITDYISELEARSSFTIQGNMNGYFSENMLSISFPAYANDAYMGILILHTPTKFLDNIVNKTLSSIVMPFLVLMVLSLIVLMLISNGILQPIREIIATSKQYAAGNFNARINVHTKNEFGELARYMEEMADELSRSNEYRKSFISNISHDFRSPLTSIKGYIEAMLDGTIPPENHEKYLNIVLNETKRLTKLTQGLLELNNFDSFDLRLDKSNFDIKSIIMPTINTFEGRCQDKGIYLHAIFHTENTTVYADRIRIQQVIYNLVDNAIKFTPEGRQITVQVTEKNDKVVVSVKDEGVGIPPESLKKVFDRFYKTDPSRGKDKTGTGLGLAITKEIIKAHGETITVESVVGEGSEFIFSLPMQKEMQVPIKAVHLTKHNEEAEYISNGKFRVKKN
jgi:signal transduction histidine kinase